MNASVIIPSHNKLETLLELMRALKKQTTSPDTFEVVVVDDRSTDGTPEAISALELPFSLKYVRLDEFDEVCPSRVRNRGLAVAAGDVAIFLDADVFPGPGFVAEHIKAHAEGDGPRAVIGYTYAYTLKSKDRTPEALNPPPIIEALDRLDELLAADPKKWEDGRERFFLNWKNLKNHKDCWYMYWSNNCSVTRSFVLELGGFDEDFKGWGHEDTELGFRLSMAGAQFVLARDAWAFHYPHPVNDSSGMPSLTNARRFLGKYPSLSVESFCLHNLPDAVPNEFFGFVITGKLPATPAMPGAQARTLISTLDREASDRRQVAWIGAWPDDDAGDDTLIRFPDSGAERGEIAGLFLPAEDQVWAGVVVVDFWRHFRPVALARLCKEVARAAPRGLLVWTRGTAPACPLDDAAARATAASQSGTRIEPVAFDEAYGVYSVRRDQA